MRPRPSGFSLIELIMIIALMGILLAISALYFGRSSRKSQIERQTKEMYADLMSARTQALYQKQLRTVTVTANQYTISPWNQEGGTATVLVKPLAHPVTVTPAGAFTFDERGTASATVGICVNPSGNAGSIDSVLIFSTNLGIGKRNAGGACASAQIAVQ